MAFRVELTPRAAADADAAATYIQQLDPRAAARWFDGLVRAVVSLEEVPRRCPMAPEAEMLGIELRQLLYGKRRGMFRIVFRIDEESQPLPLVRVIAIRRTLRDRLKAEDLGSVD